MPRCHGLIDTVIAARVTTTGKHARLPTDVPLSSTDPLAGFVVVDDLIPLDREEMTVALGALSPSTMLAVSAALRIALP